MSQCQWMLTAGDGRKSLVLLALYQLTCIWGGVWRPVQLQNEEKILYYDLWNTSHSKVHRSCQTVYQLGLLQYIIYSDLTFSPLTTVNYTEMVDAKSQLCSRFSVIAYYNFRSGSTKLSFYYWIDIHVMQSASTLIRTHFALLGMPRPFPET